MDKLNELKLKFITYANENGNSPFDKYLKKLPVKQRAQILAALRRIEIEGIEVAFSAKLIKYLEAGIYEARIKTSDGISREFFFHRVNNEYIITNGYTKKTQKMDRSQFDLAKKYKKDYEVRQNV